LPFARPTLTALRNTAVQDITTSGIPGLSGLLRNAVLRVLAWCMAALAYSVYGYADWIARMGVPFTAEDEFLFAWAALIGVYPKGATAATGTAIFTGDPRIAATLPLHTPLTRQDATPYRTTADGTIDATGSLTVPIEAMVTGAYTNADPHTAISIAQPVVGINSAGVMGLTEGGADAETQDALRTRMLMKYREPPQGGDAADYVEWATEVPGVTRAWCHPVAMGPGTVSVFPMFDGNAHGGFPQGTDGVSPLEKRPAKSVAGGDQRLVADHIYPLQPVTAMVYVVAPVAWPVDVELEDLVPNDAAAGQAIVAALSDMLLVEASPGCTLYPSQFYQAILAIPGIDHFVLASPAGPITALSGYLPVMGTLIVPPP
jgi:uncharacterized phage protein gp47/JayE